MDLFPVWLSLRVSVVATVLTVVVGIPIAWFLSRRRHVGKQVIVAGVVLAFCRAFGDFGITLMVAGNIPGRTQTLPLAIYDLVQANAMREANLLALLAVGAVIVLLVGVGRLARVRY